MIDVPDILEIPLGAIIPAECPFCGSLHARLLAVQNSLFYLRCCDCYCIGPAKQSETEAVIAWNKRPMGTLLRKTLDGDMDTSISSWCPEAPTFN